MWLWRAAPPPSEAGQRRRRRTAFLAQLVGKGALPEDQQCTLEVAKIIREDFLQQNGFTDRGFTCPLAKLKVIVGFHEAVQKTMAEFACDQEVGWNTIGNRMKEWVKMITDMNPLGKVVW